MLDSNDVLGLLNLVYTIYSIVILSLFAWFAYKLTGGKTRRLLKPGLFYAYIVALIFIGVSIHILTFNKIPWVALDLKKDKVAVDQTFEITMKDHQFVLPSEKLVIQCGDLVKFDVTSEDLTYGFGIFRQDNTLVLQMQVVPGSANVIVWQFHKNGVYNIRSTEYSGPKGAKMFLKDAVEVMGCEGTDLSARNEG